MENIPDKVDQEEDTQGTKITNPNLKYVFNPKSDAPCQDVRDDDIPELYIKEKIDKR